MANNWNIPAWLDRKSAKEIRFVCIAVMIFCLTKSQLKHLRVGSTSSTMLKQSLEKILLFAVVVVMQVKDKNSCRSGCKLNIARSAVLILKPLPQQLNKRLKMGSNISHNKQLRSGSAKSRRPLSKAFWLQKNLFHPIQNIFTVILNL